VRRVLAEEGAEDGSRGVGVLGVGGGREGDFVDEAGLLLNGALGNWRVWRDSRFQTQNVA
jgi:hypothetical protein